MSYQHPQQAGYPTSSSNTTTKRTYVTTETSDMAPAHLKNSGHHHRRHSSNGDGDEAVVCNENGHRMKKKYTTTTVTTVTTTTVLLPKMQEAFVYEPVTQHYGEQAPGITNGGVDNNGRPMMLTDGNNGSGSGSRNDNGPLAVVSRQPWTVEQRNEGRFHEGERAARPPTLQELGITSYFDRSSNGGNRNSGSANGSNYHQAGPQHAGQQPWVMGETHDEVEGGTGAYYR